MPINELTGRHRELGRLKFGEDTGDRPRTLDTWRLTSPHQNLLEAAAELLGGEVHPRGDGEGFELITDTAELEVLLPRQDITAGQWFELWTAGGLQRRCDGDILINISTGEAAGSGGCLCDPEARECKPTTVLRVVLPQLPDLGVWRLTTRSYYAAAELPNAAAILFGTSSAALVPAVLALEERKTKRAGERTKRYTVPVLRTKATLTELLEAHHAPQLETIYTGAGPTAVIDLNTGEIRPLSPPESHETPSRAPEVHEEELEPIPTEWEALAAFLAGFHPSNLKRFHADELVAKLIELEELMLAAHLWHPTEEGLSPLDASAGRHFDAEGSDAGLWRQSVYKTDRVRAFAQRAAMAAHTATNETRLGARALAQAEANTKEEELAP